VGHDYSHKHVYGYYKVVEEIKKAGFKVKNIETFYLFYGLPILTKTSFGMCTWILAQK
jgi:hypothetical protein